MLTQDVVIETVRDYARRIEACGVKLRMVILYGSFAKGMQHEWSDIDVALVADKFNGDPFHDRKRFPYIKGEPYVRIETRTYPTEYFLQSDPFIEEIKKDGIVIINK